MSLRKIQLKRRSEDTMHLRLLMRVLSNRRILEKHEGWTRDQVIDHQAHALQYLRSFSSHHSRFYESFHKGLESKSLHELPILTKDILMEEYDSITTDLAVRKTGVLQHIERMTKDERYLGRYWVSTTSGSTGKRGAFLWNEEEWAWILASYSRTYSWSGIKVDLLRHKKMAVVSSRVPWHQSSLVGASVNSPLIPTLRIDSTSPLNSIVSALNEFKPDGLVGYASMLDQLALEQLEGRLKIHPMAVISASEVLTDPSRNQMRSAWQREPFNVYAATETAGVASECSMHRMHLFEDLVITEVVDDKNHPVPPGESGAKVLVTVLFSRTLPLIRYEMSDRVLVTLEKCDCGLPFGLIDGIEGRDEDFLILEGHDQPQLKINPNIFHRLLESKAEYGWQIVQSKQKLTIKVLGNLPPELLSHLRHIVTEELNRLGAKNPIVEATSVDSLEKGRTGKQKLIVRQQEPL